MTTGRYVATLHVYQTRDITKWSAYVRRYVGYDKPGKTVVLTRAGDYRHVPGVGYGDWLLDTLHEVSSHL